MIIGLSHLNLNRIVNDASFISYNTGSTGSYSIARLENTDAVRKTRAQSPNLATVYTKVKTESRLVVNLEQFDLEFESRVGWYHGWEPTRAIRLDKTRVNT